MGRHDFDPLSFLVGLLFVGAGLVLLGGGRVGSVSLAWTGPIVAIGLGILIVIAVRPRAAGREDEEAPEDEPVA